MSSSYATAWNLAARRPLFRFYWWAEQKIAPGLRSSQYAYARALADAISPHTDWLDLGCGHQVFPDWMHREQADVVSRCRRVFGIDLDKDGLHKHPAILARIFGDLRRLPVRSACVDLVSANMVVEHLDDPLAVLREVHRVLRPGGAFVFHTPSYYNWATFGAALVPDVVKKGAVGYLEGRREEDVFPTHYRMNTATAVARHAGAAGFDVDAIHHVSGSAALAMLGPVVLLELLYIRLLRWRRLAPLRSNLVVVLRKRQ